MTPNYFTELGTPAAYGRLFDPARESAATAPPVVVLSYGILAAALWRRPWRRGPDGPSEQEAGNGHWRDAVCVCEPRRPDARSLDADGAAALFC